MSENSNKPHHFFGSYSFTGAVSLHYEIRTTEIKPYTYRTPLITINEYGEPQTQFSKHSLVHIKKLVLLNLVGVNSIGRVVSYEPLECVNRFLMSHHIDDDKQESEQYSKGLIHFFSFLLELQRTWDQDTRAKGTHTLRQFRSFPMFTRDALMEYLLAS